MTTTSVSATTEIEAPRHFADCDSLAIGRRVKELMVQYPEGGSFTLGNLTSFLDSYRGQCQCFALQLTRVEADLAARRKSQRAGYDRAEEIAALIIARDALRSVVR